MDKTRRCRECHGWQGETPVATTGIGITPLQGSGSLRSRIKNMTAAEVGAAIRDGKPSEGMPAFSGIFKKNFDPDQQYADLAKFLKTLLPDYDVNAGDATAGATAYASRCIGCHGADGKNIDSHKPTGPPPEYLGAAKDEPEEFAHRIQFGHARPDAQQVDIWGLAMPAWGNTASIADDEIADLIAHLKTLPDS